ncbi:hypothetical protein [Paenibacillus qinlingensis]|uniref:hypothetical protein n=1 Tax=Paenibacillus qinlingensis TaxID=1837343 RepID=UPI001567166E|nr:hypothetical protein [Paenibacillus qinlingensis]NQX59983.1 hypothetical protein [Paenibacillus qinlingensis]
MRKMFIVGVMSISLVLISENYAIKIEAACGIYCPAFVTTLEETALYDLPREDSAIVGLLSPQTLQEVSHIETVEKGWIQVHTWLGEKWIHPNEFVEGEVRKYDQPKTMLIETEQVFYDFPLGHGRKPQSIGVLAPQVVVATGDFFGEGTSLVSIETWLGKKWIRPGHFVEPNSGTIKFNNAFDIYDDTFSHQATGRLDPQNVDVIAKDDFWYYVKTDIGMKWVVPTEPIEKEIKLQFKTPLFRTIFHRSGEEIGELTPQTVHAFEKLKGSNVHYRIKSDWLGDAWIVVSDK